jgi:hypothetical protein
MKIDIDQLSYDELVDLNHRVVERLRFLDQMRAHSAMLEFRIGERVAFQPHGEALLHGTLTKYNRKTVTVVTDNGQQWRVPPGLIRRAEQGPVARNPDVRLLSNDESVRR